ncbi:telomeric repeat-binding factor 2-interacting protein 1 [Eucyclogobius newberryi]|uniref:telomeric repeat-binding factor 2-interacting protein 1 n=1 Tax=Eucyclogobius newberryi TaxID=166745 RepID=UPI003B5AE663
MSSKSKVDPQSKSLFVSEQGEPLCFYLRPGPVKQELRPLITAGGGVLCNVQKTGIILLKDPEERSSIRESTADWYVSTKYIQDCIEKKEKLNIEEYRLNPGSPNSAKRKTKSKVGSPAISGGRSAFTPEEDDAILSYVSKHVSEIGGNKLWQEMGRHQVTSHSWQSMKYRYRVQLAPRLSEYKQKKNKTQNTDQTESRNQNDESVSPQNISVESEDLENISAEMDLTQVSKEQHTDVQPAERLDDDLMESEMDETQEQQQPAQKDGPTDASANPALDSNGRTSPNVVNRPITRQQVELENIPYVKKLRSGTPPGSLFKWPTFFSISKPVSSPKRDPAEAPPKKVRRKSESSVAEQTQEEREQTDPPETTQQDEGNCPAPQPTEKKATKRKLGILEMATKEFEDDSDVLFLWKIAHLRIY